MLYVEVLLLTGNLRSRNSKMGMKRILELDGL